MVWDASYGFNTRTTYMYTYIYICVCVVNICMIIYIHTWFNTMTSTGKHCSPRQDRQASVAHLDRTDRRALLTSTGLNNKTDRGKVSSSIDSKTQRQASTNVVLKATTQAMLATCCAYATSMEANQVLAMLEVHSAPPLHLFGCCHVALLVAGTHEL